MLDVTAIRENPERVRQALLKRAVDVDITAFLTLDAEFREARTTAETLRGERNRISAEIARARRAGDDAKGLQPAATALAERVTEADTRLAELAEQHQAVLAALPNLPDDDVRAGGKENNEVVRSVGTPPAFDFAIKGHVDLAQDLGLIDYKRGTELGGNGFWIYRGEGAALEWALLNYFVDTHRRARYEFVLPPHILSYEAGFTAGQFPKFADEVYVVEQGGRGRPEQFLLPTAETALVNLHRDETLPESALPRKYFAYTPCYRKESGGYRSAERGTLRGHQFDKVELFQFVRPTESENAQAELLAMAENLVAGLGLHYRITKLAAEDTSAAMALATQHRNVRGGQLGLERPRLPGQARRNPLPPGGQRWQGEVSAHPQRLGARYQPPASRDPRTASASRRNGGRSRGTAPVGNVRDARRLARSCQRIVGRRSGILISCSY